ncbi:hypothetical protein OnM2_009017 [Erysiphe neolycopersici]|uniref:C2H2-type domain-containing protein n=1 Tax=Erysiphe neolycopersici TaxID=212602 RepID=A0A420I6S5_9PEZI|nr:hypothetical protein OnM2_009017 [Erysiphe neolycopersici]
MDRLSQQKPKNGSTIRCKSKPKSPIGVSGNRYQCPLCPKNYSRIENLTRHRANHNELGKFVCNICNKSFTRSDLLNRHRMIHSASKKSVIKTPHKPCQERPPETLQLCLPAPSSDVRNTYQAIQSQQLLQQEVITKQLCNYPDIINSISSGADSVVGNDTNRLFKEFNHEVQKKFIAKEGTNFSPVDTGNKLTWDGSTPYLKEGYDSIGACNLDISWTLDVLSPKLSSEITRPDLSNVRVNDIDITKSIFYQQIKSTNPASEDPLSDEDDTTDWPDKVCDKTSLHLNSFRNFLVQGHCLNWEHVLNEARITEYSAVVIPLSQSVTPALRNILISTLNEGSLGTGSTFHVISDLTFPSVEVLNLFLCLYFQNIHPRFPVLHLPTFDIQKANPELLLAMMFLGSSHSQSDQGGFSHIFHQRLRLYVSRLLEIDKDYMLILDNILAYFLLCLSGTWSGCKQAYQFSEGGRGILVTACRRARLLDGRPRAQERPHHGSNKGSLGSKWRFWIESEKRRRLGCSIYASNLIFDSQYPSLFNNQPYINKAETSLCVLPCSEDYWEAQTDEDWKLLVGDVDNIQFTYHLSALNCCLLRKWAQPPPPIVDVGEFGKIVLMYAIHTHIYERGQVVTMLNPTGLRGTSGYISYDMCYSLRERGLWLEDALDNFIECYQSLGTSPAAVLLNHLGCIYIDVSMSDLHLSTGRSIHAFDRQFALENLKIWANSEASENTMIHVYTMLDICYLSISTGNVSLCSYEIAIALFTGGIICWNIAKLRTGANKSQYLEHVMKASAALAKMNCWRMCEILGRILNSLVCIDM